MRVLLVDEQRLFREGLCALLRARDDADKLEIVGQASRPARPTIWSDICVRIWW